MLPIAAGFSRCFSFHPVNSAAFSDSNPITIAKDRILYAKQPHADCYLYFNRMSQLGFACGDCR